LDLRLDESSKDTTLSATGAGIVSNSFEQDNKEQLTKAAATIVTRFFMILEFWILILDS
jgi:hypothetical protein